MNYDYLTRWSDFISTHHVCFILVQPICVQKTKAALRLLNAICLQLGCQADAYGFVRPTP